MHDVVQNLAKPPSPIKFVPYTVLPAVWSATTDSVPHPHTDLSSTLHPVANSETSFKKNKNKKKDPHITTFTTLFLVYLKLQWQPTITSYEFN